MNGMMGERAVIVEEAPAKRSLDRILDVLTDVIGDTMCNVDELAINTVGQNAAMPVYEPQKIECLLDQAENLLLRAQVMREKVFLLKDALYGRERTMNGC